MENFIGNIHTRLVERQRATEKSKANQLNATRKENVNGIDLPSLTFYLCDWLSSLMTTTTKMMMMTTATAAATKTITTLSCSSFEYFTVEFVIAIPLDSSNYFDHIGSYKFTYVKYSNNEKEKKTAEILCEELLYCFYFSVCSANVAYRYFPLSMLIFTSEAKKVHFAMMPKGMFLVFQRNLNKEIVCSI